MTIERERVSKQRSWAIKIKLSIFFKNDNLSWGRSSWMPQWLISHHNLVNPTWFRKNFRFWRERAHKHDKARKMSSEWQIKIRLAGDSPVEKPVRRKYVSGKLCSNDFDRVDRFEKENPILGIARSKRLLLERESHPETVDHTMHTHYKIRI